jgi:hypothetical protein
MLRLGQRLAWLGFASVLSLSAQDRTAATLARSLRDAGLDPTECYRVRDLSLVREDLKIFFTDGYLIFGKPVSGERLTAVFSGDVEGGDGEVLLLPPNPAERRSLARYTQSPNLDEHFRAALLIFSDATSTELLEQVREEGRGRKASEMGPVLAEQWAASVANTAEGFTPRLVQDLLSPARPGGRFLFAAVAGKHLGNFDLIYDPRAPEQIFAAQMTERNGRPAYDIWTSFSGRAIRSGRAERLKAEFSPSRYQIDASLDQDLRLKAKVRVSVVNGASPLRVFAFAVSRAIKVTSAKIDGVPAELLSQPADSRTPPRADENTIFLTIAPQTAAAGSTHEFEFDEEGAVITSPGNGVYFVGARANWYPRAGDTYAVYDLNFRYPKRLTLAATGEQTEDRIDGDWRITRRRTPVGVRVVGFNLGDYERVTAETDGVSIEVYANRRLEPALAGRAQEITLPPVARGRGARPTSTMPAQPSAPDPLARLHTIAADGTASYQYFTGLFGPSPVKHLTVSPIPGAFGQGFPGLLYLSTAAFLDPTERPIELRGAVQQVFFSDLMEAHEVAHQWWGNVVTNAGYQDEWLMEALANYSSLLWLEKKKGTRAMELSLEGYRDDLMRSGVSGMPVESAGPITWGFRLESAREQDAWRAITYEKGAWIFHMLRRRLGDERFFKMLAELRRRFDGAPVSTAALQILVKEFRPPRVSESSIDSFFDTWVYSTGIPALSIHTSMKGVAPAIRLTGTVEQSGVEDDFSVEVPVEIQYAKGPPETVWVETSKELAEFTVTLKQTPLRISIPIGTGVLAVKK